MSETIYMIENLIDNTFWTNNGFKKRHGNLYIDPKIAQRQIDKGKLSVWLEYDLTVKIEDIKISKFKLERDDD